MDQSDKVRLIAELRNNYRLFAAHNLIILDKGAQRTALTFNRAQAYVHMKLEEQRARLGRVRALILKGRQQGISTYIGGRFYHRTSMVPGLKALIIAHEAKATDNLFKMVKRYQENNPMAPSTKATNSKELLFGALDSGYGVATAGAKDTGRSLTAQLFHGCLGAGALVLMDDGSLRTIESLGPGDMVRTRRGFAAPVKGISWHPDQTREVGVELNGVRFRATDSHKFWTRRGMVKLEDLRVGDELGFPVRQITEEVSHVQFASEKTARAQGGGRSEASVPETIALTFELGRMLGLYLAEGYVAKQSKAPHELSSVVFACHARELERNTGWIRCVGGFSSLSERENKGSQTRMTVAYGRQFASFVMRMCGRTDGKHLPHEWWRMPREFVRGLLVGYLAGDGHCSKVRERRIQAPSIVPAITYGMRDVVAALGYGYPSVGFRGAQVKSGRNEKAQYTLRITGAAVDVIAPMLGWEMPPRKRVGHSKRIEDGYVWLAIESIGDRRSETVWDIEVDHPDHDYCLVQCATSNSEFAFWDNAQSHMAGIGNAVGDVDGTEIILESTGNGIGNAFHLMWQLAEAGIGEYIPIFVPWYWQDEYCAKEIPDRFELSREDLEYKAAYGLSDLQMVWRANKIATYGEGHAWLFDQEYPATPVLAFQSPTANPLISPSMVARAMNNQFRERYGAFYIGCDPAEYGDDRTAIVFRHGRVVFRIETYEKKGPMEVAGMLARYWLDFKPDALVVDRIGIGSGIVDRLKEQNIPVIGINSAQRADDAQTYANKRAEMWWVMKDWIDDYPVRLPNDMALASDLSAPGFKHTSNGLKLLESKDDMRARGIRSPDIGDALALTFAVAVAPQGDGEGRSVGSSGATAATSAGY